MMETSLKPLSLSRRTKGSCNCYSRGLTAVAVNVTGYNGRRFSDTELRGRGSRGAPEGGSSWFNRAGGVSSFTGVVCTQLRFPVAFAPVLLHPMSKVCLEEKTEFSATQHLSYARSKWFQLPETESHSDVWSIKPPDFSLKLYRSLSVPQKEERKTHSNPAVPPSSKAQRKTGTFLPRVLHEGFRREESPKFLTSYRPPDSLESELMFVKTGKYLCGPYKNPKPHNFRPTDSSVISVGFTLGHRTDREGCVRFRGRIFCRCGRHTRLFHIAILGLDSAGKTTVLYRLQFNEFVNTVPTKVLMRRRSVMFHFWDVGGQEKLRPLWKSYTRCTDGIIFVVDSVDAERMEEAKTELHKIAKTSENQGVPLLVVANKQDLRHSLGLAEIEKLLALKELGPATPWHLQPTCAIIGDGLREGLDRLYDMILKRRKVQRQQRKKR
ncbi:hypothetical protein F7725_018327 [Dissostichus mawsoni]|uniref:ADP-ribosylation factor-like protein 14 n=1 Tax=Dissostichus mawsoni TaxID=36200 RepID=A0A7J5XRA9_DISMA|nr:hypothetical protein F7725_018327 [Dissostichus mawsoni]